MPNTASKRDQARREARVMRAHQTTPVVEQTATRRATTPTTRRTATGKRYQKRRGPLDMIRNFPVLSVIILLAIFGGVTLYAQQNKLGPFAPIPPKQAVCNLKTHVCNKAPLMTINTKKTYIATIHTAKGDIVIKLDAKDTPITVNSFVFLAQQHFFDGTYFWRVEKPGKPSVLDGQPSTLDLIQGGAVVKNGNDPKTVPGYTFKDEKFPGTYTPGTVAMANAGPNTNGNQFFINTGDNSSLPKSYTIFGTVTSGLDVAKQITAGDKMLSVTIKVQ
ncbi:MAG: peptidylprolyl isomerase [Ktedonobacterales bacterium]